MPHSPKKYLCCRTEAGSGFFIVDPVLSVGKKNSILKLDSVSCQTHLSKSLGDFSTWKMRLEVAHKSGFNMVHFTPIQVGSVHFELFMAILAINYNKLQRSPRLTFCNNICL